MTIRPSPNSTRALSTWVTLAFLYVYIAWGMTFMAIHLSLESLPPFLVGAGRFSLAGWILLAFVAVFQRRDFHWGSAGEWRDSAVVGTALFLGGNGSVVWAQQYVNTSTAALINGTIPLFIILIEWLRPGGVRPALRAGAGLLMGFAGLCILIAPAKELPRAGMEIWGEIALLLGAVAFAAGAIYSRFHHSQGSPLLPMARQMICGGIGLLLFSLLRGDLARFSPAHMTLRSMLGFAYLVGPGSLLGFTAYAWLLRVSTPERVSTTNYINTVVAALLGWSVGEHMSLRVVIGAVIIVASVVLVLKKKSVRDIIDASPADA